MKEKIPKSLKIFSLIVMLNLLFSSCEKELYEQPTDTSFSPLDAKEWYYSNLKKSEKFKVSNKNNNDKLPDWKNGSYRKIGDFEMIEFPLMKNKKAFLMTKDDLLSEAEKRRVLSASLTRVVFIKNGNNKIELRELNYIPEYKYLARKGFDISGVDLSKEKNDFTGTLIIKTWDSHIVSKRIFSNGKVIATIKFGKNTKTNINKKNSKNASASKTKECVLYEDQYWEAQCVVVQQGDQWVYTGECDEWVLVWVSAVYEVCDPVDPCADSTDPNCQCEFYSIGCNEGGGDPPVDPPADPPKAPCENALSENNSAKTRINNPIVNGQVSIMTQSIATDLNEKSFVFGTDSNGQYQTSAINTGGNSSVSSTISNLGFTPEAITHTHTANLYNAPSTGDIYQLSESNAYDSNIDYHYTFAADGSIYVLTITNQNDFDFFDIAYPKSDYFDATTNGWKSGSSILLEFNEVHQQMLNLGKSDDESYEIAMAFVISNHNMGITLNKMDNNGNFISIFVNAYTDPSDPTKTIYSKTTNCNLN